MAMTPDEQVEALKAEVLYYKRQLGELAAEGFKRDTLLSGTKSRLKQKNQSFALLSQLARMIGTFKDIDAILIATVQEIVAKIDMDRSLALVPAGAERAFRPIGSQGYSEEMAGRLTGLVIQFPEQVIDRHEVLLVNSATPETPFIKQLREQLELRFFLAVPIAIDREVIGLLVSGREKEYLPIKPPLDEGDIDTSQSLAGLIASSIRNMRLGALQEKDRLKTEFFANISHEFRTPITLTLGPLEALLAGRHGQLPEEVVQQCHLMVRNQHRLLTLINQILDLAKLEAGQMKLKVSPVRNLNEFCRRSLEVFRPMATGRGVELREQLADEVNAAPVFFDVERIETAIFNLLSNALKFTKKGFVELSTAVDGSELLLSIRDSGVGIRKDQIGQLFERFRQADGSATREFAGTGIGLALVKQIVELHGGRVEVQSVYGEGTTFHLRVPLGAAHYDPAAIVSEATEATTGAAGKALASVALEGAADTEGVDALNAAAEKARSADRSTLLFTDDNADLRRYVHGLLAPHYNVFLAINGADGLEKAARYGPDIILSDLMMPKMTGIEFCQALRRDPRFEGLPFVLLTAKATTESKIDGLQVGADDYLSKPFSEPELAARLKNLLLLRQNQQQVKRDLVAARGIQQAMLPARESEVGNVQIQVCYRPSEDLSGDFYDFRALGEWMYVLLADVTSHGTAAAQVTYLVRELFRRATDAASPPTLQQVVHLMREGYAAYQLELDVGFLLMRLHQRDLTGEVVRGNAPSPVMLQAGRANALPMLPNMELSARRDESSVAVSQIAVPADATLFLFTDGAFEFRAGGRPFGMKRLLGVIGELPETGWSDALVERLTEAQASRRFGDDITVLRVRPVRRVDGVLGSTGGQTA
jgi:signal transduction histidine kinase/CheY-like chemotaxis protein